MGRVGRSPVILPVTVSRVCVRLPLYILLPPLPSPPPSFPPSQGGRGATLVHRYGGGLPALLTWSCHFVLVVISAWSAAQATTVHSLSVGRGGAPETLQLDPLWASVAPQ